MHVSRRWPTSADRAVPFVHEQSCEGPNAGSHIPKQTTSLNAYNVYMHPLADKKSLLLEVMMTSFVGKYLVP